MRISVVWQIGAFLAHSRPRYRSTNSGAIFDTVFLSGPERIGVNGRGLGKQRLHCLAASSKHIEWKFQVTETVPSPRPLFSNGTSLSATCTLLDCLMSHQIFPTASQARRAIRNGEILVLKEHEAFDPCRIYSDHPCSTSAPISESDQVLRVTRLCPTSIMDNQQNSCCYPVEATKYVYPPAKLPFLLKQRDEEQLAVVYENDEMAVVHKPVSIVTIEATTTGDTKNNKQDQLFDHRDDLQSLLPFILYPPPPFIWGANNNNNNNNNNTNNNSKDHYNKAIRLPRPVHRLDRGTSGLVLVAKTKSAMNRFSKLFAERQIRKTYAAVVFGRPDDLIAMEKERKRRSKNQSDINSSTTSSHEGDERKENGGIINYPIDGKPAVTEWRIVETNDLFSRLELQPKTGRYHQLRLHLAYCLGSPIVGDTKYDLVGVNGGGKSRLGVDSGTDTSSAIFRKSFRDQGLFLCCHKLEFNYPFLPGQEGRDIPTRNKEAEDSVTINSGETRSFSCSFLENTGPEGTAVMRMKLSTQTPEKMQDVFRDTQ